MLMLKELPSVRAGERVTVWVRTEPVPSVIPVLASSDLTRRLFMLATWAGWMSTSSAVRFQPGLESG